MKENPESESFEVAKTKWHVITPSGVIRVLATSFEEAQQVAEDNGAESISVVARLSESGLEDGPDDVYIGEE